MIRNAMTIPKHRPRVYPRPLSGGLPILGWPEPWSVEMAAAFINLRRNGGGN